MIKYMENFNYNQSKDSMWIKFPLVKHSWNCKIMPSEYGHYEETIVDKKFWGIRIPKVDYKFVPDGIDFTVVFNPDYEDNSNKINLTNPDNMMSCVENEVLLNLINVDYWSFVYNYKDKEWIVDLHFNYKGSPYREIFESITQSILNAIRDWYGVYQMVLCEKDLKKKLSSSKFKGKYQTVEELIENEVYPEVWKQLKNRLGQDILRKYADFEYNAVEGKYILSFSYSKPHPQLK